jgi:hypothetical protein
MGSKCVREPSSLNHVKGGPPYVARAASDGQSPMKGCVEFMAVTLCVVPAGSLNQRIGGPLPPTSVSVEPAATQSPIHVAVARGRTATLRGAGRGTRAALGVTQDVEVRLLSSTRDTQVARIALMVLRYTPPASR